MVDWILDPWRDPLVLRAIVEIALVGLAGGALGCWILLSRLSYGAESLSHALFPGLVAAALLGIPLVLGAAAGLAVAAVAVGLAGVFPWLERDTGIAVVVPTLLGAGVLLALSASSPPGLDALLFGDVLGVTDGDLLLAAGLGLAVVAGLAAMHKSFLVAGFDRANARAFGVNPVVADMALLALLCAAILVGVQGLGNLLVVALIVGPAAIARRVTRRIVAMMCVASVVAIMAGIAGLYLSYHAGTAAGASVVAVLVTAYIVVTIATMSARDAGLSRNPVEAEA